MALVPCVDAVNDPLAMWELTASGGMSNKANQMCLGLGDDKNTLAMVTCSANANSWEFTASGQLKLASGSICAVAKQMGESRNVALFTGAFASSTASQSHGVLLA